MGNGETDLATLIAGMDPVLDPETYIFTTVPADADLLVKPLMRFSESEGDTLILTVRDAAKVGISGDARFRRITLTVHSALEAVGLTAAFASALGAAEIPANVVAGYYHDHIFIPENMAERAVEALRALADQV
ncbi:ACT domain-containing protein [Rhodospirillaceae bacterium KN72]|uniref:ACT domain-containing protein n=1 Tax=Pacificispira spongiicola TaxID=2729598 RepID=A0A7Y0E1D9_9PROT|nr:ACT domain-containing protein [Pacificispira spongiicola]NMM45434.1 ACT domain-containing protein [Pacificispira spongiicola]